MKSSRALRLFSIAVLILSSAVSMRAQEAAPGKASPADPFEQLTGIYGHMIDGILTQLAKPETAAKIAKFQKNHFDALIKEGFSREDAMKIVISTQFPFVPTK